MSRYRRAELRMWSDARFRSLSIPPPNGRDIWIALLIGECTTMIPGVVIATPVRLADSLGWGAPEYREAFDDALHDVEHKMPMVFDMVSGLCWLPNGPKHNKPNNPSVIAGWKEAWAIVPECALKDRIKDELTEYARSWGVTFLNALESVFDPEHIVRHTRSTSCPTPCRPGVRQQEQDQEQDQDHARAWGASKKTTARSTGKIGGGGSRKRPKNRTEGPREPPELLASALAVRYREARLAAGLDWPPAAQNDAMPYFERAEQLCTSRGKLPGEWLQFCMREYPRFAGVRFPTPAQLTSASMFERFLVDAPGGGAEHESTERLRRLAEYDRGKIELLIDAGLEVPPEDPPHLRGQMMKIIGPEVSGIEGWSTLTAPYHFHSCLLASLSNPEGLAAWARRRETHREQFNEVAKFAREKATNGARQHWATLLRVADALEVPA